jgi:UDP-2-acetamido-2,6-beta-L-arabino-hexul-4-ose reductase
MRILITGANGFIAKNLILRLKEKDITQIDTFLRSDSENRLQELVNQADLIFHLAGENRPKDLSEFEKNNVQLTQNLCRFIKESGRRIPVIFTSSAQAVGDTPYANSKVKAEEVLSSLASSHQNPVTIFRLPGVFGKGCKPNYNSVVATFCHNIAHDLPIEIHDPKRFVKLVYLDDVLEQMMVAMSYQEGALQYQEIEPQYDISLGDLAHQIQLFRESRNTLLTPGVGSGLVRALYATYLSYLSPNQFSYSLPVSADPRGRFVEMLKTADSGQFSFFTAFPGVTRGGHYHHSKTEKFLVVQGEALFTFRNLFTDETYEIHTSGAKPEIVETIPGWVHAITNTGQTELIALLWANEIFNRERPDTYSGSV